MDRSAPGIMGGLLAGTWMPQASYGEILCIALTQAALTGGSLGCPSDSMLWVQGVHVQLCNPFSATTLRYLMLPLTSVCGYPCVAKQVPFSLCWSSLVWPHLRQHAASAHLLAASLPHSAMLLAALTAALLELEPSVDSDAAATARQREAQDVSCSQLSVSTHHRASASHAAAVGLDSGSGADCGSSSNEKNVTAALLRSVGLEASELAALLEGGLGGRLPTDTEFEAALTALSSPPLGSGTAEDGTTGGANRGALTAQPAASSTAAGTPHTPNCHPLRRIGSASHAAAVAAAAARRLSVDSVAASMRSDGQEREHGSHQHGGMVWDAATPATDEEVDEEDEAEGEAEEDEAEWDGDSEEDEEEGEDEDEGVHNEQDEEGTQGAEGPSECQAEAGGEAVPAVEAEDPASGAASALPSTPRPAACEAVEELVPPAPAPPLPRLQRLLPICWALAMLLPPPAIRSVAAAAAQRLRAPASPYLPRRAVPPHTYAPGRPVRSADQVARWLLSGLAPASHSASGALPSVQGVVHLGQGSWCSPDLGPLWPRRPPSSRLGAGKWLAALAPRGERELAGLIGALRRHVVGAKEDESRSVAAVMSASAVERVLEVSRSEDRERAWEERLRRQQEEAERRLAEAAVQAQVREQTMREEGEQKLAAALAEAAAKLATLEAESGQRLAMEQAEGARQLQEAERTLACTQADASQQLAEAVQHLAAAQAEADRQLAEAAAQLAAVRAEGDRRLAAQVRESSERLAAIQADAEARLQAVQQEGAWKLSSAQAEAESLRLAAAQEAALQLASVQAAADRKVQAHVQEAELKLQAQALEAEARLAEAQRKLEAQAKEAAKQLAEAEQKARAQAEAAELQLAAMQADADDKVQTQAHEAARQLAALKGQQEEAMQVRRRWHTRGSGDGLSCKGVLFGSRVAMPWWLCWAVVAVHCIRHCFPNQTLRTRAA